uniref:NADH-ubiquinone oxidoreductase chain 2 n=1 Tax=Nacerdes carniolica TaxID=1586422 RepID=A0A343C1Q5_9CUCU|nr:NADH dehydrogenase subunit 2 [Nacerdes carniolica]
MFFNTLILGTLISICSYSWFSMWMGLEINLLSIIPLMTSKNNMFSSESAMKYFITQALASMILLFSVILMLLTNEFIAPEMNSTFTMMLNSALLTKLGAAPFHFWFPEVMEGLSWLNCLILTTWQKIAPMILIMNNLTFKFLMIIIIFSLIISTIMNFNQTSLRKIMSYSSINHISWMISAMLTSFSIWLIYFLVYTILSINIILILKISNSFHIKQLFNILNSNKTLKFSLMLNFLSLGGLPPFIGFMPKWLTINWLILNKMYLLSFILIILTLIMLFIYIQLTLTSLILLHHETKISNNKIYSFIIHLTNCISTTSLITCTWLMNCL